VDWHTSSQFQGRPQRSLSLSSAIRKLNNIAIEHILRETEHWME
jgi:hypothetical protein